MFNLPLHQLQELHLLHFTLWSEELSSMLGRCQNLEACTLFVTKDYHSSTGGPPAFATAIPGVRSLTLYNAKNFDYDNSRKWAQAQFNALTSRSCFALRTLSTSTHINNVDIESVLGEMPSLVELDVLEGEPISDSTLRLLCRGLLGPKLEVLKCAVEPGMLSDFLDMLDCRYVPKKSRAVYRGLRSVVIRCSKNTAGYTEVCERLQELKHSGRDVAVRYQ
ncbi:hypothetical protein LshimejAT787_0212550 [Lyophyllum shimeji]|uniref:Uncharacterized protein n=1 Tax=Lyophyllum shimeji TaxID=47721 RepID=A0A9P3PGS8_LYOSH|nr:hypothetical protein LshimejAT787_0212550 [Lyophyllum shimeji]